MNPYHAEAVIFDLDGVIIDSEPLWDKSQELLLAQRGLEHKRDLVKHQLAGKSVREGAAIMKKVFGLHDDVDQLTEERYKLIRQCFDLGIQLVSGFASFQAELTRLGIPTAVATAMDPELLPMVNKQIGLTEYFGQDIYSISDVNYKSKPDPSIFLHAARRLQVDPRRCVVIEDSPHGIQAARRAGMYCIALRTTFANDLLEEADMVVADHHEVARIMFSVTPAIG